MYFDPIYLLYGAIFIGTLLLVEGTFYLISDYRRGSTNAVNRRLRMIAGGTERRTVMYRLRRSADNNPAWRQVRPIAVLDRLISQSGSAVPTARVVAIMTGTAAATFLALWLSVAMPVPVLLAVALLAGVALPILFLQHMRRARLKKFEEQLPDSIDIIVRSLRAGHPISSALGLVAQEMPDPSGTEFGIAVDEMTYGFDLQAALIRLRDRIPAQDLRFMVIAIAIQHGTGGNLAEVLSNLSRVIRDRYRMFKKIKALSAEGRLSATIISALPFTVAIGIQVMNPTYFTKHIDDPLFLGLLAGGLLGLLLGIGVMFRMVKFRV